MRGKSNFTARTKKRKGSFELEQVFPKETMTGKTSCIGGSDYENFQRNHWDRKEGISTLI